MRIRFSLLAALAICLLLFLACPSREVSEALEQARNPWSKPAVKAGQPAHDFALSTVAGDPFSLSEYRDKRILVIGIGNPFG